MTTPSGADGTDENSAQAPTETTPAIPDESPDAGSLPDDAPGGTSDVPSGGPPGSGWVPPGAARAEDDGPVGAVPPAPAPPPPRPGAAPVGHPPPGGVPPGRLPPGTPAAFGPQPAAGPPRTSRLAITALVTGLLGLVPAAIGFGIAALVQLRHRTHKGKGLAIGGMAASVVWVVAAVAVGVTTVVSTFGVEREESGAIAEGGKVVFGTLQPGDCYTGFAPNTRTLELVDAVPCTEPHRGEVMARPFVDAIELQVSGTSLNDHANKVCNERTLHLQKSKLAEQLEPYVHVVPAEYGAKGPTILCAAHYTGEGPLDTPLAETVDGTLKQLRNLRTGECVAEIEGLARSGPVGAFAKPIACTEPHKYQVFANFRITFDDPDTPGADLAPSMTSLQKQAEDGCYDRVAETIKEVPPAGTQVAYVLPARIHPFQTVVCFIGRPDGAPLEKSIVSD